MNGIFRWKVREGDPETVRSLKREFICSEIIAHILATRGFTSKQSTDDFFTPNLSQLYDPYLLKDMEPAVNRVIQNIENKVPILVFGDYDVDGTTAASVLYLALTKAGATVFTYIPSREIEGYGLSDNGIDYASKMGVDLLITCDCGINANEKIDLAKKRGIDVIVTDHHTPDDDHLPEAYAILNPKQSECSYPFKELCGAGVAFKLACAVTEKSGSTIQDILPLLELVTLGTAADMVPILDENRVMVAIGLERMQKPSFVGLKWLLKSAGLENKIPSVVQLVFGIAPKINAAGRLGDANRSVTLLTTKDNEIAKGNADILSKENDMRKEIQNSVIEDAMRLVNADVDIQNDKAIILYQRGWHPGVVGIVASKIKEEYHRPAIVISIDNDGIGKGSARSIEGFDLYKALTQTNQFLDGYGGHPMAAGLTVKESNLDEFKHTFLAYANDTITNEKLVPTITLDGELKLKDITSRFITFLDKLGPYGPGNMRPKFVARGVEVVGNPRIIGRGNHLRFRVRQRQSVFDAIGFNLSHYYEKLIKGFPVDLAFVVEMNEWQGQSYVQLNIRDIKLTGRES